MCTTNTYFFFALSPCKKSSFHHRVGCECTTAEQPDEEDKIKEKKIQPDMFYLTIMKATRQKMEKSYLFQSKSFVFVCKITVVLSKNELQLYKLQ